MKKQGLLFLFIALFNLSVLYGQETTEKPRTLGLTASLQYGQIDIKVPVWVSQKVVLAPFVSAFATEDVGKTIGFGLAPRFYINTNKLSPYLGARLGGILDVPKNGDNVLNLVFGSPSEENIFLTDNLV